MKFAAFGLHVIFISSSLHAVSAAEQGKDGTAAAAAASADQKLRGGGKPDAQRELWQPKCPDGNGRYCGDSYHVPTEMLDLDPDTLYRCDDGHYYEIKDCSEYGGECEVAPPGHPDYCKRTATGPSPRPRCPYGKGYYCGDSKNVNMPTLDPEVLYRCDHGRYHPYRDCEAKGKVCYEADPGHPDYCKPSPPGPSPGGCADEICRFKLEGSGSPGLCLNSGGENDFLELSECDGSDSQTWRIYAREG